MFRIFYAGNVTKPEVNNDQEEIRTDHGHKLADMRMGWKFYQERGHLLLKGSLCKTHTFVGTTDQMNKDHVFLDYQGENVDANFSQLIRECGATHTSMSIGDVLIDSLNGDMWFCDHYGWTKI